MTDTVWASPRFCETRNETVFSFCRRCIFLFWKSKSKSGGAKKKQRFSTHLVHEWTPIGPPEYPSDRTTVRTPCTYRLLILWWHFFIRTRTRHLFSRFLRDTPSRGGTTLQSITNIPISANLWITRFEDLYISSLFWASNTCKNVICTVICYKYEFWSFFWLLTARPRKFASLAPPPLPPSTPDLVWMGRYSVQFLPRIINYPTNDWNGVVSWFSSSIYRPRSTCPHA